MDQHQRRSVFFLGQQAISVVERAHWLPALLFLRSIGQSSSNKLTSGNWGINGTGGFGPGTASHPQVDEAHGYIYFISNKDNVVETQLYRVSLRDKSVTRITREAGTHQPNFARGQFRIRGCVSRTAMTPPRQDLDRIDGTRVAVMDENKSPSLPSTICRPSSF